MEQFAQVYYSSEVTVESSLPGWLFPVYLIVGIIMIIAMWKVFEKAGQAGWKAIIPFYNVWVLFEIAGRPGWWMFLMLIPIVNLVVVIMLSLELAEAFGKSAAFGIFGLWLFSFIGYLILAFGDAEYQLGKSAPAQNPTPTAPPQQQ